MLDSLYENIGGKIKNWAKWIFIVEAIGAVITGVVLMGNDDAVIGVIVLVCGPIVAWVGSWILYAFGELVEDVHAIRNQKPVAMANATPVPSAAPVYTTRPSPAVAPPVTSNWICSCGRTHAAYEMSCVCGVTKTEAKISTSAANASAGGWTCTCGRSHAGYESSCVCGMTKTEAKMKNSQNN